MVRLCNVGQSLELKAQAPIDMGLGTERGGGFDTEFAEIEGVVDAVERGVIAVAGDAAPGGESTKLNGAPGDLGRRGGGEGNLAKKG